MITLLIGLGISIYTVGLVFMSALCFMCMGFPQGPGLLETAWYTIFWPIAIPIAAIKHRLWGRGRR